MTNFKKVIITLTIILIILALIFAFYDLQISKLLVNRNSGWANFLECYGMIPGLIVILSGIFINYSSISKKSDAWSYIKKVIFFLAIAGLLCYLMDVLLSNLVTEEFFNHSLITFLVISFCISLIILIILQIKEPIQNKILIHYSNTVIGVAIFGYVFCIQVVKYFWGRIRFRELNLTFSNFTPWYLPQGITGFDSFPSGHAAMGFMLLPLIVLFSNKNSLLRKIVIGLILIWGIVLALSRVIIGAHFASDVLFGSAAIIFWYFYFERKENS